MSLFIKNNHAPVYSDCNVTIIHGKITCEPQEIHTEQVEDVTPVNTSFFCTKHFTEDIIEKNIRQAIELASSKADACRRLMALETQGYIILSNVKDEQKAELVNPFAIPKFTLTAEDFKKARNR